MGGLVRIRLGFAYRRTETLQLTDSASTGAVLLCGAPGVALPMNTGIKRVYEPVERSDGMRVLVDRLWPRGLSKDAAQIDVWAKELAPSHELRRWFHSDEGNWAGFKRRYRKELSARRPDAEALRKTIGRRKATFLYASKAEAHNHAQLLKAYLEEL